MTWNFRKTQPVRGKSQKLAEKREIKRTVQDPAPQCGYKKPYQKDLPKIISGSRPLRKDLKKRLGGVLRMKALTIGSLR